MSKGYTSDNFLSTVPYPLTLTKPKVALETATAEQLEKLFDLNYRLLIYPNIEELDEALCDILAKDYKVDWYLYNGTLDSKRAQIANCIYVHRHLGTKSALVEALRAICPGSDVEEWFEYDGNPYYFRIICDVTEQKLPITHDTLSTIAKAIKPARAVMEDYSIIYRSRFVFSIGVKCGYCFFLVRMCGTYPDAAYQGHIEEDTFVVSDSGTSTVYTAPKTSATLICGTFPKAAKQGVIEEDVIVVSTDGTSTTYSTPNTAEDYYSGTYPETNTQGGIEDGNINLSSDGYSAEYTARYCGTALGSL